MGTTTAIAYIAIRAVSGVYTSNLSATSARVLKNKKPQSGVPFGTVVGDKVYIDPGWSKYLGLEIGGRKLGGSAFPTLPDVAEIMLLSQNTAAAVAQVQSAQSQMMTANAQSQQAMLEVIQQLAIDIDALGKPASAAQVPQVPPPVLTVPETTAPIYEPFPIGGDGGGGGGGD
jgi:hypothetical protein